MPKAIGQWSVISVEFGGPADGVPTWIAAATVTGKRRTRVSETMDDADVTSLEDAARQFQPTHENGSVELEINVPTTGRVFTGKIGHYCRVTVKEVTGLTGLIYTGFVSAIQYEAGDGAQTETVTIKYGVNV